MADIKTRNVIKGTIKTLDKSISSSNRIKNAYIETKDRLEQSSASNEENPESYAQNRISVASKVSITKSGAVLNEKGRQAVKATAKNTIKAKEQLMTRKSVARKGSRRVKASGRIKSTKRHAKNSSKVVGTSYKGKVRTAKLAAASIKKVAAGTIAILKAIIAAAKALVAAIAAGGWIAVVVLLIIVILGSAITFFGNTKTSDYIPVNTRVESYEPLIRDYAKKYVILEYVELVKAVMMAESAGEGTDPMGAGGKSAESSIEKGCKKLADCLRKEKVENPVDIANITKALALYDSAEGFPSRVLNHYPFGRFTLSMGDGQIVEVAKSQIGNAGGKPYWSWYGFNGRVEWCACFVSWCADRCGYIDEGVIPKFAACRNGAKWFKERGQWKGKSYAPASGDIIFFDWKNDGDIDHVGIVERCENGRVYTIEGNSGDRCRQKQYTLGYFEIQGYGLPSY